MDSGDTGRSLSTPVKATPPFTGGTQGSIYGPPPRGRGVRHRLRLGAEQMLNSSLSPSRTSGDVYWDNLLLIDRLFERRGICWLGQQTGEAVDDLVLLL